uniref:C2H2-type domain-containing protein n=1 Tax=Buteo japonicus TaxID=224669 RepID=A0A8C0ATM3_9AVES
HNSCGSPSPLHINPLPAGEDLGSIKEEEKWQQDAPEQADAPVEPPTSSQQWSPRTHPGGSPLPGDNRSDEAPNTCQECGKSFRCRSALVSHHRRHTHTGERPYWCEECGTSFRHRSTLTVHHRVHSGRGPTSAPSATRASRTARSWCGIGGPTPESDPTIALDAGGISATAPNWHGISGRAPSTGTPTQPVGRAFPTVPGSPSTDGFLLTLHPSMELSHHSHPFSTIRKIQP